MKTETKHTPTPWLVEVRNNEQTGVVVSADPMHPVPICDTGIAFFLNRLAASGRSNNLNFYQSAIDQRLANAAFIVDACNNYERVKAERDELAAALGEIAIIGAGGEITAPARAALAKLEKEGE